MATIGTFTRWGDSFTGAVKTLSINAKTAFKPADKCSDDAPDYRIFQGSVEFGAAWKKTSSERRDYLSVKLDNPSFPAPIHATLAEGEEASSFSLISSCCNGDRPERRPAPPGVGRLARMLFLCVRRIER